MGGLRLVRSIPCNAEPRLDGARLASLATSHRHNALLHAAFLNTLALHHANDGGANRS